MYKPPIEKYLANVKMTVDDGIYRAVTQYGFKVDKDELLKALRYDRGQYETGVRDGYETRDKEIIRCKDCIFSREKNEYESNYLIEEVLICENAEASDCCWQPVYPEHYCSCGERKEDE